MTPMDVGYSIAATAGGGLLVGLGRLGWRAVSGIVCDVRGDLKEIKASVSGIKDHVAGHDVKIAEIGTFLESHEKQDDERHDRINARLHDLEEA